MLEAHRTHHPADAQERPYPIYRVNLWAQPDGEWTADAWYLTGVDSVLEALAWVHAHAHGRRFELFVECGDNDPRGPRTAPLVRLAGHDPTEPTPVTGALRVVAQRR